MHAQGPRSILKAQVEKAPSKPKGIIARSASWEPFLDRCISMTDCRVCLTYNVTHPQNANRRPSPRLPAPSPNESPGLRHVPHRNHVCVPSSPSQPSSSPPTLSPNHLLILPPPISSSSPRPPNHLLILILPPPQPPPPQTPTKQRPAMQHALQRLGLKTYHMVEAGSTKTFTYWYEALRAKYAGQGRPYQRAEFDKLLGEYSVCTPQIIRYRKYD